MELQWPQGGILGHYEKEKLKHYLGPNLKKIKIG